jgi:hypothetical protein
MGTVLNDEECKKVMGVATRRPSAQQYFAASADSPCVVEREKQ